jgi:hypothetical protein
MHVFPHCVKYGDKNDQNITTLLLNIGKDLIKYYLKDSNKSYTEKYFSFLEGEKITDILNEDEEFYKNKINELLKTDDIKEIYLTLGSNVVEFINC